MRYPTIPIVFALVVFVASSVAQTPSTLPPGPVAPTSAPASGGDGSGGSDIPAQPTAAAASASSGGGFHPPAVCDGTLPGKNCTVCESGYTGSKCDACDTAAGFAHSTGTCLSGVTVPIAPSDSDSGSASDSTSGSSISGSVASAFASVLEASEAATHALRRHRIARRHRQAKGFSVGSSSSSEGTAATERVFLNVGASPSPVPPNPPGPSANATSPSPIPTASAASDSSASAAGGNGANGAGLDLLSAKCCAPIPPKAAGPNGISKGWQWAAIGAGGFALLLMGVLVGCMAAKSSASTRAARDSVNSHGYSQMP